jgi:prenyltransferase beta subunit
MTFEGGFQGRTNKLVDGCYSFWVGALIPLIEAVERHKPTRDDQGEVHPFSMSKSIRNFRY